MSASDILSYQLDIVHCTLAEHKDHKGKKIVFIHGKGEGVLRRAIIHELNYKYKSYTYQDASFQEYGYGATQVTIR
ncbi:MAG: Smr/MutS family protein [Prevotella sp.]|nr:Smr/MutS family protein [Prevotella sp.]